MAPLSTAECAGTTSLAMTWKKTSDWTLSLKTFRGLKPPASNAAVISASSKVVLEKSGKRPHDCCSETNDTNEKALAQAGLQAHPDLLRVHLLRWCGLIVRG